LIEIKDDRRGALIQPLKIVRVAWLERGFVGQRMIGNPY
jgi:hypothetical protein